MRLFSLREPALPLRRFRSGAPGLICFAFGGEEGGGAGVGADCLREDRLLRATKANVAALSMSACLNSTNVKLPMLYLYSEMTSALSSAFQIVIYFALFPRGPPCP